MRNEKHMKRANHNTSAQATPSLAEMSRWPLSLRQLHERLTPYFARCEPLGHALLYLQAVLSDIPRKNGWQIAEQARQLHPYGMQRLLSRAVWDHDGVREELRSFVAQTLKPPVLLPLSAEPEALFPVLVIDESGFPKRGRHSAGVQPQYCGATGQIENCQVGIFLSYVTALGHGLIDRELYLPEEWCRDLPRRQAAHIPPSVRFQTKPELAQHMLERAQVAGLPIRWVVGDTDLRPQPRLASLAGGTRRRLCLGGSVHRSRLRADPRRRSPGRGGPAGSRTAKQRRLAARENEHGHQGGTSF
jgi:SRSO17 transposase